MAQGSEPGCGRQPSCGYSWLFSSGQSSFHPADETKIKTGGIILEEMPLLTAEGLESEEFSREDKSKQRKSKKRKAKSMDAADKFNLLDIILTETDDENYCSASENNSKDSSSDDEWK